MLIAIIMQEMINKVCILVSFSCAVRNCLTHCSHNSSNFGRINAACLFGDVLDWSVLCIVSQLFFLTISESYMKGFMSLKVDMKFVK